MAERPSDGWRAWLEPLRPGPERRERLRAGIGSEARGELARRSRRAVLDVAARWTRQILPVAAAVTLAFGWAALRGGPPQTSDRLREEQLVQPDSSDALPGILVSRSDPSADRVLQSVVYDPR